MDLQARPIAFVNCHGTWSTTYNSLGQPWLWTDPENVTSFQTYNALGEPEYSVTPTTATTQNLSDYPTLLSSLNSIAAGTDRLSRTTNCVCTATLASGVSVHRTVGYVWKTLNSGTASPVWTNEVSVDGLRSWSFTPAGVAVSQTTFPATGVRTVTATAPDGSCSVSTWLVGRFAGVTNYDANNAIVGGTACAYDAFGRCNAVTDVRRGQTSYTFNHADLVTKEESPTPVAPATARKSPRRLTTCACARRPSPCRTRPPPRARITPTAWSGRSTAPAPTRSLIPTITPGASRP